MSLLDLLAPDLCIVCRRPCRPLPDFPGFCRNCLQDLPWRMGRMELNWPGDAGSGLSAGHTPCRAFAKGGKPIAVWIACEYRPPIQHALLQLKFHGQTGMARPLAGLGLQVLLSAGIQFDAVVAIPLHEARLKERGYNQAHLLARPIAERLPCADLSDYLVRVQSTQRQSQQQSRESRFANLKDAFALDFAEASKVGFPLQTGGSANDRSGLVRSIWQDRRILLVDDVMTTGATLQAAAIPLLRAGALVGALVIASDYQAPVNRNNTACRNGIGSQTGENTLY